jgi:hypothetical protein
MKLQSIWPCLAALLSAGVSATALTYKMQPNEKACFFTDVGQKGAKIAFYFAVGFFSFLSFALLVGVFFLPVFGMRWNEMEKDTDAMGYILGLWHPGCMVDDGCCWGGG